MNKEQIKKNSFHYFIYSILAWDDSNRKVEDDPRNNVYFLSPEYKKSFVKDLEICRKKNIIKILYMDNPITSTHYNIYEKNDGELIIAFRGSDSKVDWLADFNFFKKDFRDKNNELLLTMSNESFDKLCVEEYVKSMEDEERNIFKIFNNIKYAKLDKLSSDICGNFNLSNSSIISSFDKLKSKIQLHGGFLTQYISIYKELNETIDKYVKDKRFNKITFVGHSLGSNLARLSYIFQSFRHSDEKNKFSCYVAGTPKLGNISFTQFMKESNLNSNCYIMNIKDDLVSMLPPDKFGFTKDKNDIEIEPIKAPFPTKCNHTLFYYLYCIKNFAPIKVNDK